MHPPEWDCLSFSFFFFPAWPFVRGVCRCSRGHNIPIFISWIYSDAKAPSQWTNTCSFGRLSLTQCLLFWPVHSHPSPLANQCLRPRNVLRLESFQITPPYPTGKSICISVPIDANSGDIEFEVRCQFSLDIFSKNTLEFFISFTLLFDPWSENFPQAW